MARIDGFAIVKNEEEQIRYMLDCFLQIKDLLGVLSIVDNGSSDETIHIIQRYKDKGLPIEVHVYTDTPHHGILRTRAISLCTSPFIVYLDADETWSSDMLEWLKSGEIEKADRWDFYKYSTIVDCHHFTEGGNGPSTRMFRNVPGVHFPQNIHTYPEAPRGLNVTGLSPVLMFHHTCVGSREALWAKAARYQWAQGTIGIGPLHEYIGRLEHALSINNVVPFSPEIEAKIFTGPERILPE